MYKVKLENFEGPLDLLLFFVRKDELDIYDIPIAHITRSYLEYLHLMHELNLDIAAEFILMAATLMRIKVKSMLPKDPLDEEEEEALDPREELTRRLIEYRQFKEASKSLAELDEYWRSVYRRSYFNFDLMPQPADEPVGLKDITFFDLLAAYKKALAKKPKIIYHNIERINVTIEEQQEFIFQFFGARHCYLFTDLCSAMSKIEIVVTFLAMLDLIKRGTIAVKQATIFDDIWVYKPEAYVEDEMEAAEHAEEKRIEAEEQAAAIRALKPGAGVVSGDLELSAATDSVQASQDNTEIQTADVLTGESETISNETAESVGDLAVKSGTDENPTGRVQERMGDPSDLEQPGTGEASESGHITSEPADDSRPFEDDVLEPTLVDGDESEDESILQYADTSEYSQPGAEASQGLTPPETTSMDVPVEVADKSTYQAEPPLMALARNVDDTPAQEIRTGDVSEKQQENVYAGRGIVTEMAVESSSHNESDASSDSKTALANPVTAKPTAEASGEPAEFQSGFRTFIRRIIGFMKQFFSAK